MIARLLFLAFLGLLACRPAAAQECINVGGYPWAGNACVRAGDLDRALEQSPGSTPPSSTQGQGANLGKLWLDTSVTPYALRMCRNSICSPSYVAAQWALILTVDSSTGIVSFPSTLDAPTLRDVTTGTVDLAQPGDGIITWKSAATATKAESLAACTPDRESKTLYVIDAQGTSGTYAITLVPQSGNVILGPASITNNYGWLSLICDGSGNWLSAGNLGTAAALNANAMSIGLASLRQGTSIYTATGSLLPCTALLCVWNPTTPADATLPLPTTPQDGETHTVMNSYAGYAYTLSVTSSRNIRMPNGIGTVFPLTAPQQTTTFAFSSSLNSWGIQ